MSGTARRPEITYVATNLDSQLALVPEHQVPRGARDLDSGRGTTVGGEPATRRMYEHPTEPLLLARRLCLCHLLRSARMPKGLSRAQRRGRAGHPPDERRESRPPRCLSPDDSLQSISG